MNARAGLETVRRDVLLTTLAYVCAVLTILLPVAALRDLQLNPWFIGPHVAIYVGLIVLYLNRRRLQSHTIAAAMLLAFYFVGTFGLLRLGTAGLNILAYALIVIATPMAFGLRIGALAALACATTYFVIGWLVRNGSVTFNSATRDFIGSPDHWLYTGIMFAGFCIVLVAIAGSMCRKIKDLVNNEVVRSQMLKGSNEQLAEANERLRQMNDQLEARISERTRRLEETNRELESFSYSVSHDLRSPLQVIEGFSSLALQEEGASARSRDHLQRIQASARRMQDMIGHLLRFSQLASVRVQTTAVNLSELAESIVTDLRMTHPDRDVLVDIEPGMMTEADAALIGNVVQNLLANAWKFTAPIPHARIEFARSNDGGEQIYVVRDNGVGFCADRAQRLFEPFVRLHDRKDFCGHGIGLATARRIIQRHGGRIWAESRPGEGAAFFFILPMQ
jgi:signal transduction histidine kinase